MVTQVTGTRTHTRQTGPFFHPPPKLVQMLGGVSTSSACIGTLDKRGFQACDQGSTCRHASQPDRPPRKQLPQPLSRKQSFVCDHVTCRIYVCHVGSLRTSACQRFDLLVSINRPETARRRRDPTQYLMIMKRLRLLPVHCARSVVVVDSHSIFIVFYHTPCCLFCLT